MRILDIPKTFMRQEKDRVSIVNKSLFIPFLPQIGLHYSDREHQEIRQPETLNKPPKNFLADSCCVVNRQFIIRQS
jgi:hypothetical protein